MARARNIKPSFFENEYLADLPFSTRLLFIGLWTLADREGRLEDRPKRIKGALFPYDLVDVDEELQALADSSERFITRYTADDGRQYIQVTNFTKHQSPHIKEQDSVIPPPSDQHGESLTVKMAGMAAGSETGDQPSKTRAERGEKEESTVQAPCKLNANMEPAPGEPDASTRATPTKNPLNPESLNLNPESLNPKPLSRASARGESGRGKVDPDTSPQAPKPQSATERRFETFWSFYPKKAGKIAARKAFEKIKMDEELHKRMLKAIILQKKTDQWQRENGRFIPNPATWLNRGEWDNETPEEVNGNAEDRGPVWDGAGGQLRSGPEGSLDGFKRA